MFCYDLKLLITLTNNGDSLPSMVTCTFTFFFFFFFFDSKNYNLVAALKYADSIFAERFDQTPTTTTHNECPRYDTKPSDNEL